jgi:hypothetical protein
MPHDHQDLKISERTIDRLHIFSWIAEMYTSGGICSLGTTTRTYDLSAHARLLPTPTENRQIKRRQATNPWNAAVLLQVRVSDVHSWQ